MLVLYSSAIQIILLSHLGDDHTRRQIDCSKLHLSLRYVYMYEAKDRLVVLGVLDSEVYHGRTNCWLSITAQRNRVLHLNDQKA